MWALYSVEKFVIILGVIHKSRDGKVSKTPPFPRDAFVTFLPNFSTLPPPFTHKSKTWLIQQYQLINALFSSLYTASYSSRDFLYWRLQLRKSKPSITENNISNKCVDVKTISWFMDICLERWSEFGFENPEQMELNSLVNHKKKNGKMSKSHFVGSKKSSTLPPPSWRFRDALTKTLPPRHVIYGWSLKENKHF